METQHEDDIKPKRKEGKGKQIARGEKRKKEEEVEVEEQESKSEGESEEKDEDATEKDFIPVEKQKGQERTRKRGQGGMLQCPIEGRGVIYLGHLPHGFYEPQMRAFFRQFGKVTRLRMARSKKTGHCKGFAFIEFEHAEVAQLVAETMNGYLLFEKVLKSKVIPPEECHPFMFKGAHKKWRKVNWRGMAIKTHNQPKTPTEQKQTVKRLKNSERKKRRKLEALGIDYDFPGYAGEIKPKAKHIVFSDEEK